MPLEHDYQEIRTYYETHRELPEAKFEKLWREYFEEISRNILRKWQAHYEKGDIDFFQAHLQAHLRENILKCPPGRPPRAYYIMVLKNKALDLFQKWIVKGKWGVSPKEGRAYWNSLRQVKGEIKRLENSLESADIELLNELEELLDNIKKKRKNVSWNKMTDAERMEARGLIGRTSGHSPQTKAQLQEALASVFSLVNKLNEDQKFLIAATFLEGKTCKETACDLHVTHEKVRQDRCQTLQRLDALGCKKKECKDWAPAVREIIMAFVGTGDFPFRSGDQDCLSNKRQKKIFNLYFNDRKTLSRIAREMKSAKAEIRRELYDIVSIIFKSKESRGAAKSPSAAAASLNNLVVGEVSAYIDHLPYGMRKFPSLRSSVSTAATDTIHALCAMADLLYIAYHPMDPAPRNLRQLISSGMRQTGVTSRKLRNKLGIDLKEFAVLLDCKRIFTRKEMETIVEMLGADPLDLVKAALVSIAARQTG